MAVALAELGRSQRRRIDANMAHAQVKQAADLGIGLVQRLESEQVQPA